MADDYVKSLHLNTVSDSDEVIVPKYDLNDKELLELAERYMGEASSLHEEVLRVQEQNEKYYLGDQTKRDEIPSHKCDAVENHQFTGIETIVPIITANTPQFVCMPADDNERSAAKADAVQEILKKLYQRRRVGIKKTLRKAVRHMLLYRLGVLKPFWDESIDNVNVKAVRPQRLWISRVGDDSDSVPCIMEKLDMDEDEIRDSFGDQGVKKVKEEHGGENQEEYPEIADNYLVWEYWFEEFVFWKCGGAILDKRKNPYYDFGEGEEDTEIENKEFPDKEGEEEPEGEMTPLERVQKNHFDRPRKPYIFLSPFSLGKSIYGDTDLITQTSSIQDIINSVTRKVVDNAGKMGNAAWFVDSGVMEEEDARNQITNEEGLIVYGPSAANPNFIRREAPPALPNYILEAKYSAQAAFDNIFGTHATTKGQRSGPETLGGRLLLKQSDISRNSPFVDEVDEAVSELGNWWVQLMKLYYEEEQTFKVYGEKGVEFIRFNKNNIEQGIEIIVKEGSTIQEDEMSRKNEALILWQNGALDPMSLYERMKFPDPRKTAQRLVQWQMGQLLPEQGGQPPPEFSGKASGQMESSINPQQEMREAREKTGGTPETGRF